MKEKKYRKRSALAGAVLLTFSAVLWTILTVLRLGDPDTGSGPRLLTVLTLFACLAACVTTWRRCFHYDKNNDQ